MPTARTLWNIPYRRNQFFTGREDVLEDLHRALQVENRVALSQPQGISGLGGIGKTQTVVEYAYRHQDEYEAIFWVRADSLEALTSSLAELARLLQLSESNEQDQEVIVQAVLRWLRLHSGWLLIYDNIDDFELVDPYLPRSNTGHLLFTTRARAFANLARRLEILQMEPEIGALLLLRRASLLAYQETLQMARPGDQRLAQTISQEMDGLPLALDQAGAYIKETSCILSDYLTLYQNRRGDLLSRRGDLNQGYPASVATTWSLSFEKVSQAHPAAPELLNLCAFLAPDAIPEKLLFKGAAHFGEILAPVVIDQLQFNQVCREILRFSLLQRGADEHTLTVHRLVQAVLRNNLPADVQQQWMRRVVPAIDTALPDIEFDNWPDLEQLVPHLLVGADWIEQVPLVTPTASHLLDRTGRYLSERARYGAAEPLLKRGLAIREQEAGPVHADTATSLANLATLYLTLGKFAEAEAAARRVLEIREQIAGPEDLDTASALSNLSMIYFTQEQYKKAQELGERALAIHEKVRGTESAAATSFLNNLALVYHDQGKSAQAEDMYLRALKLDEQSLPPEHPDLATMLNNLASFYQSQERYAEAAPLYHRALAIREKVLGQEHPATAQSLASLATLYRHWGRYPLAEQLALRALELREKVLGLDHPSTETILSTLEFLYRDQRKFVEAEHLFRRVRAACTRELGEAHPRTIWCVSRLEKLAQTQGKYAEAAELDLYLLALCERELGLTASLTAVILDDLAMAYRNQNRFSEAEQQYQRAIAIREKELGPNHASIAGILNNYAYFYQRQRRYVQAEPLYLRALSIREQNLGSEHPDIAVMFTNLAGLYCTLERYSEAEPLYQRALTIQRAALGDGHVDTLDSCAMLATFYANRGRYAEAEALYQQALAISQQELGISHYVTKTLRVDYAAMLHNIEEERRKRRGWRRLLHPFFSRQSF